MKRNISISAGLLLFLLFFNGITRHDIAEADYLALAKQKQFDCVVQVFRDTASIGSGVLISERYILSAAHIVVESDTREETVVSDGQTITLFQPYNIHLDTKNIFVLVNGQRIKAKKVTAHPTYAGDLIKGECDLLLIELEKPVKGIVPAIIGKKPDEMGANVTGCGFGASGQADKPEAVGTFHKKIAGENTIDSLSGKKVGGNLSILMADFDHPSRTDCNIMGSAVPRPFEYAPSGGDSGGGLFRQRNGKWELIGICSGSAVNIDQLLRTGYYGQTMSWTRVSVFADWIRGEMSGH